MSKYQIAADQFLPVFSRGHQVMLAIFDAQQNLYLARKPAYPPGIYRLFGGGVEPNESSPEAAKRELREETGLELPPELVESFIFTLSDTNTHQTWTYQSDLYAVKLQSQPIIPADDVPQFKSFTRAEVLDLLTRYTALEHGWNSWGQIFGLITRAAIS